MSAPFLSFDEGEAVLSWTGLTEALAAGHRLPRAEIADTFLYRDPDTLLSRAAWIDGLGALVKTATIFPRNPEAGLAAVNGGVTLYGDGDGLLQAVIDFHLVTKWKTAGDSLLAARRLADPDARTILIVGAGTVAASLIEAFSEGFPAASFLIWNRSGAKAKDLAHRFDHVSAVGDLEAAVHRADIVLCATMSSEPVLRGAWLRPGQHVNLIGAYRPDMREVDDEALLRAQIFVDSIETTADHIGELKDPLARGVIARSDIRGDFYDLDRFAWPGPEEITLFKNGGGAHLDLMTAHHVLSRWRDARR